MNVRGAPFTDMPCYAGGLWPLDLLTTATWLEFAILLVWSLHGLIWFISGVAKLIYQDRTGTFWFRLRLAFSSRRRPYIRESHSRNPLTLFGRWVARFDIVWLGMIIYFVVGIASLVALWLNFGYILQIRNRARSDFGASYDDDTLGYGQIISAGFAAEAIWNYLYRTIGRAEWTCVARL